MKRLSLILLAVLAALILSACQSLACIPNVDRPYTAELLMPGNTLVVGECDGVRRLNGGWIKVRVNGKWYACHETRVVLVEVE